MILKKIAFTLILGSLFLWVSLGLNILSQFQPEISRGEIGKFGVTMVISSLPLIPLLYLQASLYYRPWQGSWWGKYLDKHHIVNQMTSYFFSILTFIFILFLLLPETF